MLRFSLLPLILLAAHSSLSAQNLQRIGHLPYAPLSLAGCWHHVDSAGGEWALVGTSAGLSIVDLSDPAQPVERFSIPGPANNWREVRTWGGFAYFGSEATGSGITIADLRALPDSVPWKVWRGDGIYDSLVVRSHTVQAQDGYLYIFGGGNVTNGTTIAELSDPWNPHIIGTYTSNYVHDGFIRGDTLWTSEIYKGWFGVVDISDKTNPSLLATQSTPGAFNHNTELSPDGKTLFTTDEKTNAPLAAFDVSTLDNITLLDRYFVSKKPSQPVHNVRVFGDFLVCPSYGGQLSIVDATRPDNLIETAWDSLGNSLVWDADPYLPSGIVFATAKNEGLFVYQPTYQHAAWLEGMVTDSATGAPLADAKVFVLGTLNADSTNANGGYKTGAAQPGLYGVFATRPGYTPKTISNVSLQTNQVTTLDIALAADAVGIQNIDNENFVRVSPTVFDDYLQVEIPEGQALSEGATRACLTDFSGKMVWEKVLESPSTRAEGLKRLPAGQYVFSVWQSGILRASAPLLKI
jgi:choice-of-anchor B domain-containing protein